MTDSAIPETVATAGQMALEWAVKHVDDLGTAKMVRDYLRQWADGPQFSMLSVERVAAILSLTRQAVLHNIKTGRTKAVWYGRAWMVPFSEVDGWQMKVGRPKNQKEG